MDVQRFVDAPIRGENARRRTADVLVEVLVQAGIEVVFGLPGGTIAPVLDSLLGNAHIRVVTTRNETGAMFAAAAYARATGRPGVVMVTSGPGVINTMTGLASAHCDGLPVIVLSGEVAKASFGKRALQEGTAHHLDIVGMASHITKLAYAVTEADAAPVVLRRAIRTVLSGRQGPALLTLPIDVLRQEIAAPLIAESSRFEGAVDVASIERAANALRLARRPVIFAGSGARWGDGPDRLRDLAERLQAPVMTTPKGKGVFPESHPLSLGVFGHGGHPSASAYLATEIDVLLAVGTGLSDPATNGWSRSLVPTGQFIQIDADMLQIGRNYAVTQGIVGPADRVLEQLAQRVPRGFTKRRHGVRLHQDPATLGDGDEGFITPQRALWELQQCMPSDTHYACDIGEHLLFATHYLRIDDPQGFLIMTGLASMGSAIPAGIGLKLASPERPVVAICGDGCFSMSLGDVQVAAQEGIPLLVMVLNDQRYGMVELGNLAVYGRTPTYSSGTMDVASLARGVGADALVVRHTGELLAADLPRRLERGPVVVDVHIDRSARMPKNARFEELARSQPETLVN